MSFIARRTRAAAVAAATAAVVTLAGCSSDSDDEENTPTDNESSAEKGGSEGSEGDEEGSDSDAFGGASPDDVADQAFDALMGAESLRLAGDIDQAGEQMSLDLHLSSAGDCAGSISMSSQGSFEIIKLENEAWLRPDTQFWETAAGIDDPAILGQLDGFFLYGPADEPPMDSSVESCNLDTFLEGMGQGGSASGMTMGEATEIDGVPGVTLHEGEDASLVVATEGEPFPLRFENSDPATGAGVIDFSAFNEPVPSDRPADAEVITIEDLQSGAFMS
ncbi:hypothetical protein SAMN06297387_111160 [Streptomyces zhaozhouensis]|uniref:Lipoprotein n=1 Tax=Streptomyces zhaozhouensis TaxID=1300267 RepID=A0A286DY66_9ACTN|nr:hypothetical protein [Streptomyces zhaozhouensis]SOD63611.1 hypothetical protein SAMN06297387_111160 [Streptomyces zhaozhouensis]